MTAGGIFQFAYLREGPQKGLVSWVHWWYGQRCLDCCSLYLVVAQYLRKSKVHSQLSSPSKMPGIPTRSMGMPSSASASILSGCCRAIRDAKAADV